MVRWAASALAGALFLVACGGASGGASEPQIKLTACTVQDIAARCGRLAVAEDPAKPGGRMIQLRVVVLPARGSDRKSDPLFYFEGGPGGAATEETAWARQHFYVLNQHRDIVLIDQRGTGDSNRASCRTPGAVDGQLDIASFIAKCVASLQAQLDPAFYTTPIAVDDFDAVRAALGYDKVDVYGVSYGVSSGLAYVQRHGDHVRAAVFDSGSLLDYHIYENVPRSAEQSLAVLFARCNASVSCQAAYPNLASEFSALVAQVTARPVMTQVPNPATGGNVVIDQNELANVVLSGYLASTETAALLPKVIHAAARGDWTAIAQASASMADSTILAMAVTVRCGDEWSSYDAQRAAAASPSSPFTAYEVGFLSGFAAVCRYWPHQAGAGGRVRSAAPIVFLNSTGDPVDPPENVAGAKTDMPNSLVVTVAGTGHWQLDGDRTGCLDDEVAAFIDAGRPSAPGLWPCAASPTLPPFAFD